MGAVPVCTGLSLSIVFALGIFPDVIETLRVSADPESDVVGRIGLVAGSDGHTKDVLFGLDASCRTIFVSRLFVP